MRGSRNDLPIAVDLDGVVIRLTEWGEMTMALENFPAGTDTAPLFKGLPGDRCQSPHWGYVLRGRVRVRYPDREETLNAGDAFALEPGHTTFFEQDTELVEFTPRDEYLKTLAVAEKNAAMSQRSHARA